MRRLSVLFVLVLVLAACTTTADDQADDEDVAEPTPTEVVDEQPPEETPTPEPEPTPEPTPTPTPEPEDEIGEELQELVDEVAENVSELRGLELLEDLDVAIMSRGELTEMLEEELEISQSEIDLYWILRLIDDRDIDLEQMMIDVQATDVYGFYDPETKETYVIADDEELSAMEEVFLAHEITHALQDQHFGLDGLDDEDGDYDAISAYLSIVEGDAVLTQEFYAMQYLGSERVLEYQQEAMAALQESQASEIMDAVPPYIIESLSFPYIAGPMFLLQVYDGDLNDFDAFLEEPPVSTQQVLNPGAYLRGDIEDPETVEIPDMLDRLDGDWELSDSGTFGLFSLTFLMEHQGIEDPDPVLEWWDGDAFAIYENGEEVVGILSSVWEDEERAADFEDMLLETMADYSEEDGIYMGDGRFHTVIVDGDVVTLKSASDEQALLDMLEE